MDNVMSVVKSAVKFVRQRGLQHRQFKACLEKLNAVYADVPYYTEIRWLSRGDMLKKAYALREHIYTFCAERDKHYPEFRSNKFISD